MNGQTGGYAKVGDGSDASYDPSGHAMMYVLGTTYDLSKRTFLHGTVAYVRNGGDSNFSLLVTPCDATSSTSPMTGEPQMGAYVGMMHTF
ncbi:porin [Burkholderia cenocepacia]|nr:porin [Burkholderia cenocepacia]RQV02793.1 porin [Burkholderia cenocepacia]